MKIKALVTLAASAAILAAGAGMAAAYDGTKYDPKHDPKELAKQQKALDDQSARNAKRAEHFKKTGNWVYDVSKL